MTEQNGWIAWSESKRWWDRISSSFRMERGSPHSPYTRKLSSRAKRKARRKQAHRDRARVWYGIR